MEELKNPTLADLRRAYSVGSDEIKQLLKTLYGDVVEENTKPADIKERIKTFVDAFSELSDTHPQIIAYKTALSTFNSTEGMKSALGSAVVAFMQLGIIAAALNEGWTPDWGNEDDWKYYPWFLFYSKEEWDNMDEEDKCRVVGRASYSAGAYGGLVYSSARYVSASSNANNGSRLAFKSRELAEYTGKQFIKIYADFLLG